MSVDQIFERRLAHAQLLLGSDLSRRQTKKKKKRGHHRELGQRQCLCGHMFTYTTRDPDQRSCRRGCIGWYQAVSDGQRRRHAEWRRELWQRRVADALKGGRVTVGALVDMCAEVYRVVGMRVIEPGAKRQGD